MYIIIHKLAVKVSEIAERTWRVVERSVHYTVYQCFLKCFEDYFCPVSRCRIFSKKTLTLLLRSLMGWIIRHRRTHFSRFHLSCLKSSPLLDPRLAFFPLSCIQGFSALNGFIVPRCIRWFYYLKTKCFSG